MEQPRGHGWLGGTLPNDGANFTLAATRVAAVLHIRFRPPPTSPHHPTTQCISLSAFRGVSFIRLARSVVYHLLVRGSHWTDFNEILYLSIFRKFMEKIKI